MTMRLDSGHPVRGPKVLTGGLCWRCSGPLVVPPGGMPWCQRLGCRGPRLTPGDVGLYLRLPKEPEAGPGEGDRRG